MQRPGVNKSQFSLFVLFCLRLRAMINLFDRPKFVTYLEDVLFRKSLFGRTLPDSLRIFGRSIHPLQAFCTCTLQREPSRARRVLVETESLTPITIVWRTRWLLVSRQLTSHVSGLYVRWVIQRNHSNIFPNARRNMNYLNKYETESKQMSNHVLLSWLAATSVCRETHVSWVILHLLQSLYLMR